MIKIKSSILLLLCALILASCSNTGNENEIDTAIINGQNHSELLTKMKFFNDSILVAKHQTRSFVKPGAWRRAQIIAADCGGAWSGGKAGAWAGSFFGPSGSVAGAALGGLLGGVCGSYVAWKISSQTRAESSDPVDIELAKEKTLNAYATMLNEDEVISDYAPKEINVQYPVMDENVILMGAKHNIILKKLLNEEDLCIDGKQQLSADQVNVITSKEFSESFNHAMDDICKNISESNSMSLKGEDVSTKLMNLFYDILIKYPNGLTDTEFLINKYIDAVKNSQEIAESDKELIYSGLSVAASSSEFWSEDIK